DGDFAPAIRAVQEMGVRVEVISFRGNTSSDLIDVADIFTDITQIARVEKGSSRSGRRVAGDEMDLSMTEVPDKQTEGSGRGRGRGRPDEAVAVGDAGGEAGDAGELDRDVVDEEERAPARRAPRAAAFGSVWDAQIGVPREPTRTPTDLGPLPADEEFDDEPAIPEYLIAERHGLSRGQSAGAQRGGRGARSGYSAAVDRERFGRGGGGGGGGINRYPDVSRRGAPRGG